MSESYADQPLTLNRWIRQRLLRENLVSALKTFTWLGPLTLLIWVYAERAQIINYDNQTIPIDVQIADRNKFVRLEGRDKNVVARLSGPRSRVDDLLHKINPVGGPSVIIPIDPNIAASPSQTYDFDATQLINLSRIFQSSGVSVSDCKPSRLKVFVDQYEERELTVQTPQSVTNLIGAIYVPAKVTVRAPQSYFAKADADLGGPGLLTTIEADVSKANVLDKPGKHEATALVRAPQLSGENIIYIPDHVNATLDVRSLDKTITIKSVVVNIESRGDLLDAYKVSYTATIKDLTFVGPPDKIDALAKEDAIKPVAVLHVTSDDKPTGSSKAGQKPVEFSGMPEGVRVAPGQENKLLVDFTLTERSALQ